MMKKAYVIEAGNEYFVHFTSGRPKNSVCEMPKEDGKYVTDIDLVDIVEVEVEGEMYKKAIFSEAKKEAKMAVLAQKKADMEAKQAARQAKIDALKALSDDDLKTLPQMKDAIIEILDHLGLR